MIKAWSLPIMLYRGGLAGSRYLRRIPGGVMGLGDEQKITTACQRRRANWLAGLGSL